MTTVIPTAKIPVPPPKRNGNPEIREQAAEIIRQVKETTAEPLPEYRQKQVEAGLAAFQKAAAERDQLDRQLHDAHKKIEALHVQLDALKSITNMMESTYLSTKLEMENRIKQYQTQRDEAISRTASLEAVLANCYVIIRNTINEPDNENAH